MKGTLGNFVKRTVIEMQYPNVKFNDFTNYLIKKQIKGVINNAANKASKLLEKYR